jgi:hypothetical protein
MPRTLRRVIHAALHLPDPCPPQTIPKRTARTDSQRSPTISAILRVRSRARRRRSHSRSTDLPRYPRPRRVRIFHAVCAVLADGSICRVLSPPRSGISADCGRQIR